MRPSLIALVPLFLAACSGSGHQRVPMPQLNASVPGDRCRVFLAREDTVAGSIRNVRVFDGETEIGVIDEGEFLCWERRPQRGVGRLVFEGVGVYTHAVENVFDLPREPGTTSYYAIRVQRSDRKPEVTQISEQEGKALVLARTPATVR